MTDSGKNIPKNNLSNRSGDQQPYLSAHSEEDDVPLEKSAKLLNKISKMDKGGKNQEQGPTPEAEPNKSLSIKYKANPINQEYEDDYTAQEESEQIPETKPKENQKNQLDYGGYYKPQDPSRQEPDKTDLNSVPASDNKNTEDKVRDQNKRLKQELKMLAQAADNAIVRELEVRNAKRNREGSQTETGLLLKKKKAELESEVAKINQLKHEIVIMKKKLENTFGQADIISKENVLRAAQKELEKVLSEQASLIAVKKTQTQAISAHTDEGGYDEKLEKVNEELKKLKAELRKENELLLENERNNKILHEKVRKLEDKSKPPKELKPEHQNITEDDIKKLEQRIKVLLEKKEEAEKVFRDDEKEGERQKKALIEEQARLQKVIKEKEMTVRLNNLRLKELKKVTRHGALRPLSGEKRKGETAGKVTDQEIPSDDGISSGA